MSRGRFAAACAAVVAVGISWNAFYHGRLIRRLDESVSSVFRPDLAAKAWLSLVLWAGFACLFTWGYGRFVRDGSFREGLKYAAFVALLTGLLVDLNEYIMLPIPAAVPFVWFLGGLCEFALYGVVVTAICGRQLSK